ncbi:hypothetical protein D3C84_705260 [compost metagenome]|jgi:hypothetical protein
MTILWMDCCVTNYILGVIIDIMKGYKISAFEGGSGAGIGGFDEVSARINRKMRFEPLLIFERAIDCGRGDTQSNHCSLIELKFPLTTLLAIQGVVPVLRVFDRVIV